MSKIWDFSGGKFHNKQMNASTLVTLLRLFVIISLRKTNEDSLHEQDDYGVPFSEQQYTHGSCYISWFKYEFFDQSDPPESPQMGCFVKDWSSKNSITFRILSLWCANFVELNFVHVTHMHQNWEFSIKMGVNSKNL